MAKFAISLIFLLAFNVLANIPTAKTPPIVEPTNAVSQSGMQVMANFKGKNQIKLLNNRFRIDAEVDEIMLLFFRKHGSAPVVLVQPDGSKLYPDHADAIDLHWHADVGYDLIKLKSPMAGPWQALGKVLPESKILVLSDVELQVDPLPDLIYQYETIKSQAKIVNAGHIINEPGFHEVIRLRARLYSSNESGDENFGADIVKLGEFLDDGKNLDEKRRDGVFTTEYKISAIPGKWLPKFRVQAALFTREVEQEPIRVLPTPVVPVETIAAPGERYHYVDLTVDDTNLVNESLIFQGTIKFPNSEVQTFHVSENQSRRLEIFQNDYGRFTINTQVFGATKDGREIVLTLPEFTFFTEVKDLESNILGQMSEEQMANEQGETTQTEQVEVEKEESVSVLLIVIINITLLVIGFLVIWIVVLDNSLPNPMALLKRKKKATDAEDAENKEKVAEKDTKSQTSDDILDLSLPDD